MSLINQGADTVSQAVNLLTQSMQLLTPVFIINQLILKSHLFNGSAANCEKTR